MPEPGTFQPGDILTADDLNAIGVWDSYTPVLTQNVARTATVNYAEYVQINKMCVVNVDLTCTTTGSANAITVSLPINAVATSAPFAVFGSGVFYDSSTTTTKLTTVVRDSASTVSFYENSSSSAITTTLGNDDVISFSIVYETV